MTADCVAQYSSRAPVLLSRSDATNQKYCLHFFPDGNAPGHRSAGAGRRDIRDQDQENLRTDADPNPTKTSQELDDLDEKRGRGKIADPKAGAHSGEITVAFAVEKEKSVHKSQTRRDANRDRFAEEKEKLANAGTGFFPERFVQEEEKAQVLAFAHSRGILDSLFEPGNDA
jgi:hypothetical protein